MPTCPHCGAQVPEGAVYCGNCGATLNASMTSTPGQTQTSQSPTSWPTSSGGDLQGRYEKALRRTELLSYAAAILGVLILVAIVVLYFL